MAYYELEVNYPFEMTPVLRRGKEFFSDTVRKESSRLKLPIVINANFYDLAKSAFVTVFSRHIPIDASETTIQGLIVKDKRAIAGTSRPSDFYITYDKEKLKKGNLAAAFTSGKGDPPASVSAAFGGLGPLIINGLPYGERNLYSPGTDPAAPAVGDPGGKFADKLIQRSSAKYTAFSARDYDEGYQLGKTCLGVSNEKIYIVVQGEGSDGRSIGGIRDYFISKKCRHAVFFDGSDSAMLYMNGEFKIQQGENKDETCIVGIGFHYEACGIEVLK